MNFKRIAAAVLGLSMLTACSSPGDEFTSNLRERFPSQTAGATDAELEDLGEKVCDTLDAGNTVLDLALAFALDPMMDHEFAGGVVGEAVPAFCPEYQDQIDSLA